jgi:sulfite reductase alpha subunit-like flavoprotein
MRELRSNKNVDEGSTLHVEFDLSESKATYQTADNLAIIPENDDADVQKFAAAQGYNLDDVFDILPVEGKESDFKRLVPTPFSIKELLMLYLDIKVSDPQLQGCIEGLNFYALL